MLQLLFLILSYGACLLLLMPRNPIGIASAVVLFALGAVLMVRGKEKKVGLEKKNLGWLIPLTAVLVRRCGVLFYYRWMTSAFVGAVADLLRVSADALLLVGTVILAAAAGYFAAAVVQGIQKVLRKVSLRFGVAVTLFLGAVAAVKTVALSQDMIGLDVYSMGTTRYLYGALIVFTVIMFLYALIGKGLLSVFLGSGIFMVISTVNVYVFSFRERLFEPVDFFCTVTAVNVMGNYPIFPVPKEILMGLETFAVMFLVFFPLLYKIKPRVTLPKRIALLVCCAVGIGAVSLYTEDLGSTRWKKDDAENNGYILDFVSKIKEISVSKPAGYSTRQIGKLADSYRVDYDAQDVENLPHIIVIMDEAFSDLSVLGEFATDNEVMPFISSLKENTVSGYALASVLGGHTANSEYEFLTGNSMAWMPPNAVPYEQYVRSSSYSMVSYLKTVWDYHCVAMHPYYASGWERTSTYRNFGFDEMYFIEDFPQEDYIREYISDREMFEFLIETYEAGKDEPMFLFGVTMQNHGGYTYDGENFTKHISLPEYGEEFSDVERYLSLIRETDLAVEYLISYFQNVSEDVVIVFFGDHQPGINSAFYDAVGGGAAWSLEEQQKRYTIPFFVWANYDIEEKQVERTFLSYLSSYVYEAAGIPLPPYTRFLKEMEVHIPSINANGFYSAASGCYLPFDKANKEEKAWLNAYQALQYNSCFDKKHRNETLFPVCKE